MLFLVVNKAPWYHTVNKRPFKQGESRKYGQTTLGIGRKILSPWVRETPFQLFLWCRDHCSLLLGEGLFVWKQKSGVVSWPLLNLLYDGSDIIRQSTILRARVIPPLMCYVTKIRCILYVSYHSRYIALVLYHINIT